MFYMLRIKKACQRLDSMFDMLRIRMKSRFMPYCG